jgi:urease accessory protein
MEIYNKIIGNINNSADWRKALERVEVENVNLDRWSAQKSRMRAITDKGNELRIVLNRGEHLTDGDILSYSHEERKAIVVRVELSPVLVISMEETLAKGGEQLLRTAFELGHALGNQHWPAVVKGAHVYVPLTVDRKVMESVMETHHIDGVSYVFRDGVEVIPYLSPHEVRMLFAADKSCDCDETCHCHENI